MNAKTNYIKQRLSLREPLKESLDIVAKLADLLELKKGVDLAAELEKVQALYPSCKEFEREFPSLCFSIATGVGKTRLMGACISYLYLQKGIRNFFVLAPNLTIYDKLIKDFGDPGYQKYVFAGITEFVHNRPVIITGENYNQQGALFSGEEVRINIFNVSKFNAENRGTKAKEMEIKQNQYKADLISQGKTPQGAEITSKAMHSTVASKAQLQIQLPKDKAKAELEAANGPGVPAQTGQELPQVPQQE